MHRRIFLKTMIATLNGLMAFILGIPGVRFVLDPLWRSRRKATFVRVAPLSATSREKPFRALVEADRWDAFIHYPPGPIGSVWLIRADVDDQPSQVRCLQTICPHLGCGIDYLPERSQFSCPCHASDFDDDGRRLNGPSPRDMDDLACRVSEPDERGIRWIEVKYRAFQTGVQNKRPVT